MLPIMTWFFDCLSVQNSQRVLYFCTMSDQLGYPVAVASRKATSARPCRVIASITYYVPSTPVVRCVPFAAMSFTMFSSTAARSASSTRPR